MAKPEESMSKHFKAPTRRTAKEQKGLGGARYRVIKSAADRIAMAQGGGFSVETLMLTESILADRVESRLTYLTKRSRKSHTGFVALLGLLGKCERVEGFRALLPQLREWAKSRNEAAHGMAKLPELGSPEWHAKLEAASVAAERGMRLLVEFDALDIADRRANKARPSATEPGALDSVRKLLSI